MAIQAQRKISPQEYLEIERSRDYKSEYVHGEMFAMAGASEQHNLIVTNVIAELRAQLKGRSCKVYPSDMRVNSPATGLYTYPDVTIACGKAQFIDREQDTLINPVVIIEVLSRTTADYDRGGKFAHYRKIERLEEYLLISQHIALIEHYIRQPHDFWLFSETSGLSGNIELPSIQCQLILAEVYDKVEFRDGVPFESGRHLGNMKTT